MAHVVVIGAGAIGSHVLPHLARSSAVSRITIIDRDRYARGNLQGQDIDARFVGHRKASVQARRLRRINPRLSVSGLCAAVEDVPLAALRAAVLLACLDSRRARMTVNQAAWRLAVPWIDAGISADDLLARVRVFRSSPTAPCLECGWDDDDYAAVEQTYPCRTVSAAPTRAPATLAALAASLQALECERILAGNPGSPSEGCETLLDVGQRKHYVTSHRRNATCRMPDHDGWRIDVFDGSSTTTLDELLSLGSSLRGAGDGLSIGAAGQRIATELRCGMCGATEATFQLERRLSTSKRRCRRCRSALHVSGPHFNEMTPLTAVCESMREQTLSQCGLLPHDVITLSTPEVDVHLELRA